MRAERENSPTRASGIGLRGVEPGWRPHRLRALTLGTLATAGLGIGGWRHGNFDAATIVDLIRENSGPPPRPAEPSPAAGAAGAGAAGVTPTVIARLRRAPTVHGHIR